MALTGYVRISNVGKPEGVYHTQIDCSNPRTTDTIQALPIVEEDGALRALYRGQRAQVVPCGNCKPALKWKWQDDAACSNIYPAVDMLDQGQGNHHEAGRLIKEYCDNCKVIRDCAEFALRRPTHLGGIWGGVHIALTGVAHKKSIDKLRVKHGMLDDSA